LRQFALHDYSEYARKTKPFPTSGEPTQRPLNRGYSECSIFSQHFLYGLQQFSSVEGLAEGMSCAQPLGQFEILF